MDTSLTENFAYFAIFVLQASNDIAHLIDIDYDDFSWPHSHISEWTQVWHLGWAKILKTV